jgi:hypothetical protein
MLKELKDKEVEVSDLQIQMQDFKKSVFDSEEILPNKFEKCSCENNNLVKWLKIYDNYRYFQNSVVQPACVKI